MCVVMSYICSENCFIEHCKLCDKCGTWTHFHIKSYNIKKKRRQIVTNSLHHLFLWKLLKTPPMVRCTGVFTYFVRLDCVWGQRERGHAVLDLCLTDLLLVLLHLGEDMPSSFLLVHEVWWPQMNLKSSTQLQLEQRSN